MQFYAENYRDVLAVLSAGRNRDDPYAVRRACVEFSRLVIHRHAVRHKMVEDGVLLPALLEMTREHVETQPEVVTDSCRFLRRLISLKEPTELDIQSKITETGWLTLLTRAAVTHTADRKLFIEICSLVSLLCFDMPAAPHADNQDEIYFVGLFSAICRRLKGSVTEEEALAGCAAVSSILYEHAGNVTEAVENLEVLAIFSRLLESFLQSVHIVQTICRALFHVITLHQGSVDSMLERSLLQDVVQFLASSAWHRLPVNTGERSLLLWNVIKFFEVAVRHNDTAKDALCESNGVLGIIRAVTRSADPKSRAQRGDSGSQNALQYVACMLFCRVATISDEPSVLQKQRVVSLMQAGVHQFALEIIQRGSKALGRCDNSGLVRAVEQAVRLLELIARIEENRTPLTRLGASRHVKVVYNSVDMTAQPGLLVLCERAVAAIEGT